MSYDHNKYRELGVGDKVGPQHYVMDSMHDTPLIRSVRNDEIGEIVMDYTTVTYLEVIPDMVKLPTGSIRQNKAGKGRYDLIPLEGIRALAIHYENGAVAHGDRNWELGQPLSMFKNSMTRHACQVAYDFREDHAAAVAWNAFGYITTMERIRAGLLPRELDDLGVCDKEVVR